MRQPLLRRREILRSFAWFIVLAYQGLRLAVEGHTDSVGGEDYNQRLSEQRAATVRDYLVQNGISMNNVSAMGFGKTRPISSNDNPAGRQQNRRVELVKW